MEVVNGQTRKTAECDECAVGQRDHSLTVEVVDKRVVRPRERGGGADDAFVDELTWSDAREAGSGARRRVPDQRREAIGHFAEKESVARLGAVVVEGDGGENAGGRDGREAAQVVVETSHEHGGRRCGV